MPYYVGLTLMAAIDVAIANDHSVRVRSRDGEHLIGTADLNPSRVNFTLVDGRVTKASMG